MPILTPDEWNHHRSGGNDTTRNAPRGSCLHHRFEARVRTTPDAVAVVGGDESLTYRELDHRANRLANLLRQSGVGPDVLVGLCLDRGPEIVVGILGILKAGGVYVPLDLANPTERIAFIMDDTRVRVLVTDSTLLSRLPASSAETVCLDRDRERIEVQPREAPSSGVSARNLAYVIYTSGSTGKPKGVPIEHGMVGRLFAATEDWFRFDATDVWTLFHSCAFDFSVWEIWGALLYGGRVVVVPHDVSRSPDRFHELLCRDGVTVLNQTPSAFRQLIRADENARHGQELSVRVVIFGGEALDLKTLRPWIDRHGDRKPRLVNMYGITETTVHVTYRPLTTADVRNGAGSVIGRPIPDLQLHILGPDLEPVQAGTQGEIYVGGAGVARGYLNRPELTAERFLPDPLRSDPEARLYRTGDVARLLPDGDIEYLGRNDDQVQIHGFRVELGEIEAALTTHPAVADAVVLAHHADDLDTILVAFVVADESVAPPPTELRAHLRERVPEYMLPAAFVRIDALPLTPNGKLDRGALPAPDRQVAEDYVAPRDALERELAEIWQRELEAGQIGVFDPFFDVGGNSVRGATIVAEIQKRLGETVYISAIFEAPTIAGLADYLRENYTDASAKMLGHADRLDAAANPAVSLPQRRVDEETIAGLRARIEPLEPRPGSPETATRNPPAVFVLGAPRSGSTVFRIMMGGHPALFAPPELDLLSFNTLAERRSKCVGRYAFILEGAIRTILEIKGCDADEARRIMEDLEERDLSVKEFYRLLQDWIGDRTLVEKTTIYGHDPATLRRAEEDFEDPLYIHLVRHPCGMIRSFQEARLDRIFRFENPHPARELGEALWYIHQDNIVEFLAGIPERRKHRVDFEALVADPETVMAGICEFLGIDVHPDMLDPYRNKQRRMTDGLYSVSRVIGDTKFQKHKKLDAGVADLWKEVIPPDSLGDPTRRLACALGFGDVPPPIGEGALGSGRAEGEASIPDVDTLSGEELDRMLLDGMTDDQKRRLLAERMGRESAAAPKTYPLSSVQQRLWFLDRAGAGAAYNVVHSLRLTGSVDRTALERSVDAIVQRHESLRTTFSTVDGEPRQVVVPKQAVPWNLVDLRDCSRDVREAETRRIVQEEAARPIDLAAGPLIRMTWIRLRDDESILVVVVHHIAFDGASTGIFFREMQAHYRAITEGDESGLPKLPVSYGEFSAEQRRNLTDDVLAGQLAFWEKRLSGAPYILDLPTDRSRSARQSFEGGAIDVSIGSELTAAARELMRSQEITLVILLQAVLATLLSRYTGQEDIIVGLGVSNRGRAEVRDLIGFFVNTVMLRTELHDDPRFEELLRRVKRAVLEAIDHQDLPFERLVEALHPDRDPSRNPLLQVVLAAQDTPGDSLDIPGVEVSRFRRDDVATHFDLELHLGETRTGLGGRLVYSSRLFDRSTVERMRDHYLNLLRAVVDDSSTRVSELRLMSEPERHRLVHVFNRTDRVYPRDRPVHALFEARVKMNPDLQAVVYGNRTLTYGELNQRANRLARYLKTCGVVKGERVAICVERDPDFVLGLLGILKADAAYVPLDTDYPQSRLVAMLEDSRAAVLLTRENLSDSLPEFDGKIVRLDRDWSSIACEDGSDITQEATGDDLAYIMYTSGSTGRPKGVCVPHRAIGRLVLNTDYVQLGSSDRVAQASNASFDAATFEIWGALLNGARVVGIEKDVALVPGRLASAIQETGISVLFITTALFNQLTDELPGMFRPLRCLLFGGEAVDPERVRSVLRHGPPGRLLHVYGPTENTTFSTWYEVDKVREDATTVPIGGPIANSTCYVLDRRFNPVPTGVHGELYLGGEGLASGYFDDPVLTAERFVPDPFVDGSGGRLYRSGDVVRRLPDGGIEFVGRVDHQVKLRGFRIELGEIEACLKNSPSLREAVVVCKEDGPGAKRLLAYVVAEGDREPVPGDLRNELRGALPDHMIPSEFVVMDVLPLTPNGKVDRKALPPAPRTVDTREESAAPRTDIEIALASLWTELLPIDRVGVNDNFFDLGGHSLLAMQVVSRVRERFGVDLELESFFNDATVAGTAEQIEAIRWARKDSGDDDAPIGDREEIEL